MMSVSAFAATITNGDFEAGNTGFSSAYTFVGAGGPTAMFAEGTYTVTQAGETSNTYHQFWTPGVGPLGGSRYMLLNGATGTGTEWTGTATGLIVGNSYMISGWGVSVFPTSPANLQWGGAGVTAAAVALPGVIGAPWTEFTGMFVATATTQTLTIVSTNTIAQGNDFGIDNLTIADLGNQVPEPSTYALFAAGLVGIAAIRRRK